MMIWCIYTQLKKEQKNPAEDDRKIFMEFLQLNRMYGALRNS